MLIFNTITKKKEEFKPLNPPNVNMYVCGPTVYDYFHIGNARSFMMADIVHRYLIYKGYKVKFVMNVTDVDDKIIRKSNEEGVESSKVAAKYSEAFFDDLRKLKIMQADFYPRATEHMDEIIDMVKSLETKGYAYAVDGDVFYNVNKFKGYGKLSGKKIDDLEVGARIEINELKKNPLDFSLWKKAKENEPSWESPWGNGRPGWHIECSAMSCKHLGESFDIHAGGHDLIFPHHENEIAQSEAANGKEFVKYWMHFGFLNFQDVKMSKSLGNFFTTRDILAKYSAEALRLFFNQTHYSSPLSFSEDLLKTAEKALEKITNFMRMLKIESGKSDGCDSYPEFDIQNYYDKFEAAMDNDFNSPQAIAVVFDFIKDVNKLTGSGNQFGENFYNDAAEFMDATAEKVLGIIPEISEENNSSSKLDDVLQVLIKIRNQAKLDKNYKLSDDIRDNLSEIGIDLQDTKDGTIIRFNE